MAEPNPGRPGGAASSGPRSATAATFQVNSSSLKDLHTTWRTLIDDVKEFNKELQNLSKGGKSLDQITAKLGALGMGGGHGGGGGRLPGMPPAPPAPTGPGAGPGGGGPPGPPGPPSGGGGGGGAPPSSGWSWRGAAGVAGKMLGAASVGSSLYYARRMDDITDSDLFFNQQAQNMGVGGGDRGYSYLNKDRVRDQMFGSPKRGGAGGITGYQSVQDAMGGARAIFGATGGTWGGRGMNQLRQAGNLSALTPDMGLTNVSTAVGGMYDPTLSARMNSMGMGSSVGARGQLASPQQIYQRILQTVYRGHRPTERMITEGLQPGANLYVTLTRGLGLDPDQIELFARYAIAQAKFGGDYAKTDRAVAAASRAMTGQSISRGDRALVRQAGLTDSIRSSRNQLGAAGARNTIEAGREAENALISGFSMLSNVVDQTTNIFKALNGATGGFSGGALGVNALYGGAASSVLNSLGGIGGGMFAMQALRRSRQVGGPPPPSILGRLGGLGLRGLGAVGLGSVGGAAALGIGAAGLAGGIGGGLLTNYALNKAGVHNRWAHVGAGVAGGATTGALVGGGIGALFGGVGAVPGAAIGGAVGGVAGGITGMFAAGGVVPGHHDNDNVDIRATPGEVVVPKGIVYRHGGPHELMKRLGFFGGSDGGHYAKGGEVTGDTAGLNPDFLKRLRAWSAAVGEPFNVGSGYRSLAEQKVLYDRWMRKVPGQAKAAKPGSSNHNFGLAADGPRWGGKHPEKFGLRYPMSFEPWHVEPDNAKALRGKGGGGADVDTTASDGAPPSSSGPSRNIAGTPSVYSDEKSAFAAWLGNANTMYGVDSGRNSVTDTHGKSTGMDSSDSATNVPGAPSDPSGNVKLGKSKAEARGWTGKEWDALYSLFQKESGWRTDAANPSSSARGIAQTMMSVHFGKSWQKDKKAKAFLHSAGQQIDWGLNYISQRYTAPSKAWAHSQKFGWYEKGAWETENELAQLHRGEMVVPEPTANKLRKMVRNGSTGQSSSGGGVNISLHMPIQVVGRATADDARRLVQMVVQEMQQNDELAALGRG